MSHTVLSGMRSTGELHIGHYFGVIDNWLKLQDQYPSYFFAADWHALTTDFENPAIIPTARRDNIIDWLSCGLNPEKATIFVQSQIKEVAELHLLFSMITPLGWLERNPTYKEQKEQLEKATESTTGKDASCLGFLAYPILQAADIAIVKGSLVPVGEDQLPHLELNRELIRRFVHLYKKKVFPEPKPLLTAVPKLLGTDNRKMSKSYGNAILLKDSVATVEKKVKTMVTDPARIRRNDPGHPEICNVFSYQKLLSPLESDQGLGISEIESQCRSGALGCGDCKLNMAKKLNTLLDPFRSKRAELENHPQRVDEIIQSGCAKVRAVAQEVMAQTREAMKI